MIGKAQRRFWKCFDSLPPAAQKLAREKYDLWAPSACAEKRREDAPHSKGMRPKNFAKPWSALRPRNALRRFFRGCLSH